MKSIGFGLERVAWVAIAWPRAAAAIFLVVLAAAAYGLTNLTFDENLRNTFASESATFEFYVNVTSDFVDPENETLVLVESDDFRDPATFRRLQDFQFELQLMDGVDSVYSPFALREAPDTEGNAPPVINDTSEGLTPALIDRVRSHPILGDKVLSEDGESVLFVVTPTEPRAPLAVARELKASIDEIAADLFDGADVAVTVSGFPTVRAGIVEVLKRDQVVLNLAGAIVGLVMSLIIFRSLAAAILAAIPAIVGGLTVFGFMGLLGVPVTVMSTVIPALVMILGYADGMHLCFAFRRYRDEGATVAEAEDRAQREVGGACTLAAVTTAVAFASLSISNLVMVRSFGLTGAVGTIAGTVVVLVAHGLITLAIGRFWTNRGSGPTNNVLTWLQGPSAAIGRFAVAWSRPIALLSVVLFVVLGAMHAAVPPQHSVQEHLPADNPANAALGRIDANLGGIFPIQVLVPLDGLSPTSPEALERVGRVHRAVAGIEELSTPLSVWSLVQWFDGSADAATSERIEVLINELSPATRARFLALKDATLVTASAPDLPTGELDRLIDRVDLAVREAGGPDVVTTGFTVINTRESSRTISNLNLSLLISVVVDLAVIAFAFRSVAIGLLAFLPNIIPIVATGSLLFILGRGMQFTSIIALTVAFGIAVDDSLHFFNRFRLTQDTEGLRARLIETTRRIGPVLLGTTLVIIAGMSTTLTSGLPTISLFGWMAATTLAVALVCDMIIIPALMAGLAWRWFEPGRKVKGRPDEVPA